MILGMWPFGTDGDPSFGVASVAVGVLVIIIIIIIIITTTIISIEDRMRD